MHRAPMRADLVAILLFYDLPHANRLIVTAGCEIGAVWSSVPGDACDWSMETFNNCQTLTRIHIPQPHRVVVTA
ncbi:hypothetical protein BC939DRAFT_229394 [Gamsiella multidivaricata]|uniref:uncharacterized protein n=1 Tax=Gamsiella multidivaricata TaxID=101098 RepID=UPI0022206D40|nr:uncharacterized protein BC939DRAFT_229394 [Gamsiella multidivaricata]KAI7820710.1 hypothetical protein BC939DRAFT_229394 [Gamsiella multidivaricata]